MTPSKRLEIGAYRIVIRQSIPNLELKMNRYTVFMDEECLLYFIYDEYEEEALSHYYDTENDAKYAVIGLCMLEELSS